MTRLESIRNNAFLLDLNMTRATKEQKIQWLCQIIDNETDKPEDEIDFALIGECSAYLRELSEKAAEATKEQKKRILQQIKVHHNQTATTKSAKVFRPSWRKVGKIVAIAATVAALLISSLTVLAKVNGYSNAWEYIKENIQKIIGMDAGDRVNEGNITLIKGGESIAYSSIEELMQTEGYDILYPATLPEGVKITQVSQQIVNENYILYSIQFSNPSLSVVISTQKSVSEDRLKNYERVEHPFLTAYLVKQTDGVFQVIGWDENYEYLFYCSDYDVLIKTINSMKGIEK